LCVNPECEATAQDAHHIIERRLFDDGGYYLGNGASLCGQCHIKAEQTLISPKQLREWIGIKRIVVPPHLYPDAEIEYDKWGNIILPNDTRTKGELFEDENVQKILKPLIDNGDIQFTNYVKYPRTFHLPWSENIGSDDKVMPDLTTLLMNEIIMTMKMDGENTTMYKDYIHARSLDSRHHESRSYVKQLHSTIAHEIPDGWRIVGENLYAKHSIYYDRLPSYFMVFSVWNEKNVCLSWDDTVEYCDLLGLTPVYELYRGTFDAPKIVQRFDDYCKKWSAGQEHEGYVIRLADAFHYSKFRKSVAKFVRKDHVQTHSHWMREQVVQNKLRE